MKEYVHVESEDISMRTRIDLCKEWRMIEQAGKTCFTFPAPEGAGIRPYGFDIVNDKAVDVMGWHGFC